jgi:tRNA dimethylallyltransferase
MPPIDFTRCWYLSGPTASGKTAVGLELARQIGAEILSLDSMALYRGLDIGTAKPTPDQQRQVRHHLIDLVEPEDEFSVAQYCDAAAATVAEITARGRQALFVGGTPLYLKSLLRGIFEGPPADWAWRNDLEAQAAAHEPGWLHSRLAEVDPRSAARLHPHDTRRLIRALEVFAKTGRPISDWQQQFDRGRAADECRVFVLDWPREQLYERINGRVEAMFAEGLVAEVQSFLEGGRRFGRTAQQAVGYREVLQHLEGQRDLAATIELVQQRTRQFSRRQLTWFRSLSECRTVAMTENGQPVAAAEIARRIADYGAIVVDRRP